MTIYRPDEQDEVIASVDQGVLFDDPEDPDAGCMRWGMCEQAS